MIKLFIYAKMAVFIGDKSEITKQMEMESYRLLSSSLKESGSMTFLMEKLKKFTAQLLSSRDSSLTVSKAVKATTGGTHKNFIKDISGITS